MSKQEIMTRPLTYAERLVLETEGRRGAAERGWLGRAERYTEEVRQEAERQAYEAEREAWNKREA